MNAIRNHLGQFMKRSFARFLSFTVALIVLALGVHSQQVDTALDPGKHTLAEKREVDFKSLHFSHSPVLGRADAPITIVEFSDLQCPFCARALPTLHEVMEQYPNQIKLVFKNFPLAMHRDALLAHLAVLAAGEQGKFWEMHDLIFASQKALKRDDLLQRARSLNLDIARFTADLENPQLKQRIQADKQEGVDIGVAGTPTFFINGKEYSGAMSVEQFKAAIEKQAPLRAAASSPATLAEIAPDDITMGSSSAPITLVWFSDLASNLTLKATLLVRQLMNIYPGKIRVVFRNRPLDSRPNAQLLHEAALAANAQGKFWPMHDLIVANPQKTTLQDVISYAHRLGLNVERFQAEMESHKYRSMIRSHLQEAKRRSVLGSPVFFLNSTRIDGLQPQKMFDDLIAQQLAKSVQASSH